MVGRQKTCSYIFIKTRNSIFSCKNDKSWLVKGRRIDQVMDSYFLPSLWTVDDDPTAQIKIMTNTCRHMSCLQVSYLGSISFSMMQGWQSACETYTISGLKAATGACETWYIYVWQALGCQYILHSITRADMV